MTPSSFVFFSSLHVFSSVSPTYTVDSRDAHAVLSFWTEESCTNDSTVGLGLTYLELKRIPSLVDVTGCVNVCV